MSSRKNEKWITLLYEDMLSINIALICVYWWVVLFVIYFNTQMNHVTIHRYEPHTHTHTRQCRNESPIELVQAIECLLLEPNNFQSHVISQLRANFFCLCECSKHKNACVKPVLFSFAFALAAICNKNDKRKWYSFCVCVCVVRK